MNKSIADLVNASSCGIAVGAPPVAAAAARSKTPVIRFVTNPYKRAKTMDGVPTSCPKKPPPVAAVTPSESSAIRKRPAAAVEESDDDVVVLEETMPPDSIADPFAGKNILHMKAVDVLYNLVFYRVGTNIIKGDTKENRSRRGRVVAVRNYILDLTPEKDRKYLNPFKAPKTGLSTFEERDSFLKKTADVAEAGVVALNNERLPCKNRMLRKKWVARQRSHPSKGKFKPITKHKILITELANLLDDTKQEWHQI